MNNTALQIWNAAVMRGKVADTITQEVAKVYDAAFYTKKSLGARAERYLRHHYFRS